MVDEGQVSYLIAHIERICYKVLNDDSIIVDGVLQHHIEGIRKRLLESKEQQQ